MSCVLNHILSRGWDDDNGVLWTVRSNGAYHERRENVMSGNAAEVNEASSHTVLRAIGWVSVGVGLAAFSVLLGHEIRKRYRFAHRTPYDFYSNSETISEFGMGI